MSGLVLASGSETRANLLAAAGVAYEVLPASVDEEEIKRSLLAESAKPEQVAEKLAEIKALRVSSRLPEAMVIGADQILVFEEELVSKCESVESARALLSRMRGKTHKLISAVVAAKNGHALWLNTESATMTMRGFSDEFLDDYLAQEGEGLLRGVGCYRIEGRGIQLFTRVDGDHSTIMGLPMMPLLAFLREHRLVMP